MHTQQSSEAWADPEGGTGGPDPPPPPEKSQKLFRWWADAGPLISWQSESKKDAYFWFCWHF